MIIDVIRIHTRFFSNCVEENLNISYLVEKIGYIRSPIQFNNI